MDVEVIKRTVTWRTWMEVSGFFFPFPKKKLDPRKIGPYWLVGL